MMGVSPIKKKLSSKIQDVYIYIKKHAMKDQHHNINIYIKKFILFLFLHVVLPF